MDYRIRKTVNRPYCVGSRYFETEQEAEAYCKACDHVEHRVFSDTFHGSDDFTGTLYQIRSPYDLEALGLYFDRDFNPDAKFIMNKKLQPDERRQVFWDYNACDITLEELEAYLVIMDTQKEVIINQMECLSRVIVQSKTEAV